SLPAENVLSGDEAAQIRAVGDNTGCMALKGASAEHEGGVQPDRWPVDEGLAGVAERWRIDPGRDLAHAGSEG
ncbi:MAG TPA: aldo/keto reductase, partial [Solirubrobacteraceae bacterium]